MVKFSPEEKLEVVRRYLDGSDGVKTKKIPVSSLRYPLPGSVSEEEEVLEMRVSQEHRIWGFQNQSTFYVIWFDPTHAVCPA